MHRSIFTGMRTGRDWHEIESRANWTDLIACCDWSGDSCCWLWAVSMTRALLLIPACQQTQR